MPEARFEPRSSVRAQLCLGPPLPSSTTGGHSIDKMDPVQASGFEAGTSSRIHWGQVVQMWPPSPLAPSLLTVDSDPVVGENPGGAGAGKLGTL